MSYKILFLEREFLAIFRDFPRVFKWTYAKTWGGSRVRVGFSGRNQDPGGLLRLADRMGRVRAGGWRVTVRKKGSWMKVMLKKE